MEYLLNALHQCLASVAVVCAQQLPAISAFGEVVELKDRRFRVLKQLGEGGYAFVYLVRELPTAQSPLVDPTPLALKKVLAASGERLTEAKREVEVMRRLRHPHCLKLLDSDIVPSKSSAGFGYIAYLLFPAYTDGTLFDELNRLAAINRRLSTLHILDIAQQVCEGLEHIHSQGLAHRDLKPHNVLVTRPEHNRPAAGTSALEEEEVAAEDMEAGQAGHHPPGGRYEAVLMDFGSARPAVVEIRNRMDAMSLQEEAEAHTTGTYRAPELFDVPSYSTITAKVDVWALGCTLFHLMYGASPFQEALDKGASLPLAVLNCRIPWPKGTAGRYPDDLHSVVTWCLSVDPQQRPDVGQLRARLQQLAAKGLPNPTGCMCVCT